MIYIQRVNNNWEQLNYLHSINESNYPLMLLNKLDDKVYFAKDGTYNRKFKYDNINYLEFDKNYQNDYFIIPNDVEYIDTYQGNYLINHSSVKEYPYSKVNTNPIYKVGLMSDVHYNDADDSDIDPDTHSDDGAEYSEDLVNALNVFNDYNVDFVSCSGDISTDSRSHLKNYKRCIDKYASNLSVFTCSGNHDTKPKFRDRGIWNDAAVINPNNEYQIIYFNDNERYYDENTNDNYHIDSEGKGTSFYFKKYYNNTFDVYIYLNVEYGWPDFNSYKVHNCVPLTQEELLTKDEVYYNYDNVYDINNDIHLYHPQTLRCLADILEEFKDHRCFIFTHLMLPDKAGNFHTSIQSNNVKYYSYCDNHEDILKGDQGNFIRNLMETYDNNYWFCGHSHYKWSLEKYDHNINVTKIGNSYNIHLPSLSRPLELNTSYSSCPKDSEGAIMEVYKNYIVIKGMVMKEDISIQDYKQLINEYNDENMEYVTSEMFTIYGNNESTIEQLEDDHIQINYIYNSSGSSSDNDIYLNTGFINASNYGNYMPVLRFEDIQIWGDNMDLSEYDESFLYEILSEQKIGFRDHTSTSDYLYYFSNNHIYTLYSKGIVFKVSSDSIYKSYNLHIKMKLRLGFVNISYTNKFLPIACFKLPTIKKENQ